MLITFVLELLLIADCSMFAALDDYREYCYVRRIDARYASCLGKCFWTPLFQLLPALVPNRTTLVIIQPLRNPDSFINLRLFRRFSFLFYIRRIMSHNFNFSLYILFRKPS